MINTVKPIYFFAYLHPQGLILQLSGLILIALYRVCEKNRPHFSVAHMLPPNPRLPPTSPIFQHTTTFFVQKGKQKSLSLTIKNPKSAQQACTWQANCLQANMPLSFRQAHLSLFLFRFSQPRSRGCGGIVMYSQLSYDIIIQTLFPQAECNDP